MHMLTMTRIGACITTNINSVAGLVVKKSQITLMLIITETLCIQTIASHGRNSICRKKIAVILAGIMKNHTIADRGINHVHHDSRLFTIRCRTIMGHLIMIATANITSTGSVLIIKARVTD